MRSRLLIVNRKTPNHLLFLNDLFYLLMCNFFPKKEKFARQMYNLYKEKKFFLIS